MQQPAKLALLTAEEEVALAREVHGPDRDASVAARNKLVLHNLGLIGMALTYYRKRCDADFDDLFSEGVLGLLRAAELFDPDRHTRFSTYALPAILHQIRSFVRRDHLVHVPNYIQDPVQVRIKLKEARTRRSKSTRKQANILTRSTRTSRPWTRWCVTSRQTRSYAPWASSHHCGRTFWPTGTGWVAPRKSRCE
jgi:RNA polymerase sigma factor (sigma-70 family)